MLHPTPSGPDSSRPLPDALALPPRNPAAQRRAMQAAMANAVRAMSTTAVRRGPLAGRGRTPPAGV